MNATVQMVIFKTEQRQLSVRAERGWQQEQALRERSGDDRGVLALVLLRGSAWVIPHLRGTLEFLISATPRWTGGLSVVDGVARR
jgi:hypothetical protein